MDERDVFGWVGRTLDGKYLIERVVGDGGFGVVYRAQHATLGDPVAIKCLKVPAALGEADRDRFRESFLEEGRLLRSLSRASTGIVQALDAGDVISPRGVWSPYLALEWLEGASLEAAVISGEVQPPMSVADVVRLVEPAARALALAHEQGVAHRDIKPANLFLTTVAGRPTLKVLDFGIAKVMTETTMTRALEATGASIAAFTPRYGAPEQFNRRLGATGTWTDVFALSLVLVELLSGRNALDGEETTQLYVSATDPRERPSPRARGAHVSDPVENVFQRGLAIDPRERFKTLGEFWDALCAVAHTAPSTARVVMTSLPPVSPVARTELAAGVTLPAPAAQLGDTFPSAQPEPRRRSRGLPVALVALPIAALAVAAAWVAVNGLRPARPDHAPAASVDPPAASEPAPAPLELPSMVQIEPATFTMGSNDHDVNERPRHKVTIPRPFLLDRHEVTEEAYRACVQKGRCTVPSIHGTRVPEADRSRLGKLCNHGRPGRERHPANCVDQRQAAGYCASVGKRLPTEAEWELAASGGEGRAFPSGAGEPTCADGAFSFAAGASCNDGSTGTHEIGSAPHAAARSGAVDLAGNVSEWVADGYDAGYYARSSALDPLAPMGLEGVLRGGSWELATTHARTTFRLPFERASGHVGTGFRCARTVE